MAYNPPTPTRRNHLTFCFSEDEFTVCLISLLHYSIFEYNLYWFNFIQCNFCFDFVKASVSESLSPCFFFSQYDYILGKMIMSEAEKQHQVLAMS